MIIFSVFYPSCFSVWNAGFARNTLHMHCVFASWYAARSSCLCFAQLATLPLPFFSWIELGKSGSPLAVTWDEREKKILDLREAFNSVQYHSQEKISFFNSQVRSGKYGSQKSNPNQGPLGSQGLYQSRKRSENEQTIRKNRIHTRRPALFFIACKKKVLDKLDDPVTCFEQHACFRIREISNLTPAIISKKGNKGPVQCLGSQLLQVITSNCGGGGDWKQIYMNKEESKPAVYVF